MKKSIIKIPLHLDYPPKEGRYLLDNDYSPVAVAIVLNKPAENIPSESEDLVRGGL